MKKVGIVTFWETNDNYGQILQCWSLQQFLKSKNFDPYVIRYHFNPAPKTSNLITKLKKIILVYPLIIFFLKRIRAKQFNALLVYNRKMNQLREFDKFRKEHFNFSDNFYDNILLLQNNPPKYYAYVCGSDQIWGLDLSDRENETYFLNFGDASVKRIAYAASFGMSKYPSTKLSILRQQLSRFDSISVREKDGVDICRKCNCNADWVLDPTLLLDKESFNILIDEKRVKKDYIYIYSINVQTPEDICFAELLKVAGNKSIYVTTGSGYIPAKEIYSNVEYKYSMVGEWLALIKSAFLFVTTSFHGIAFSIIFHTPFVYVPLKGKHSNGNNRVLQLLEKLNLSDRVLDENQSYRDFNVDIDWDDVESKLYEFRKSSSDFLLNSLYKK